MALTIWDTLSHFKKTENWGDPSKMNPALLVYLDKIRSLTGLPLIINYGYAESGHVSNSQHYLGNAVDFHFAGVTDLAGANAKLQDALLTLGISDKVGLGVYPEWRKPGFHLDVRGKKARWSQISGEYVAFDLAFPN